MRVLKRVLRWLMYGFLLFSLLCTIVITLFMNLAPQIGASPEGAHLEKIKQSENYGEDGFVNRVETLMDMGFAGMTETMWKFLTTSGLGPKNPMPTRFDAPRVGPDADSLVYITWFGHSSFLLEIEGKRVLIDPVLSENAAPVSFFGQRYRYDKKIELSSVDNIGAVIISHDHYDHLDYETIVHLRDRTKQFFMPLGVGAHLQRWGIEESRRTELDWWESAEFEGLTFRATPSRHFSGRGMFDRNCTQWASWIIQGHQSNLYFSGDGGYADHFKEIGDKYGPFDFTMVECGQYNERWKSIHLMPEQTVQAHLDLSGEILMPIHWGAFTLALHDWKEPVERMEVEAKKHGVNYVTPMIGQRFAVGGEVPDGNWWHNHE